MRRPGIGIYNRNVYCFTRKLQLMGITVVFRVLPTGTMIYNKKSDSLNHESLAKIDYETIRCAARSS
jgi:hypothetical protein